MTATLTYLPAWFRGGACGQPGVDPNVFFPQPGYRTAEAARRICGRCRVRAACLEYALAREAGLSAPSRGGIWGGTSAKQRAQIDACRSGGCGHPDRQECAKACRLEEWPW